MLQPEERTERSTASLESETESEMNDPELKCPNGSMTNGNVEGKKAVRFDAPAATSYGDATR